MNSNIFLQIYCVFGKKAAQAEKKAAAKAAKEARQVSRIFGNVRKLFSTLIDYKLSFFSIYLGVTGDRGTNGVFFEN